MKKPFAITLFYLIMLAVGIFIGVFAYVTFAEATSLVAGRSIGFSKELVIFGFFESITIVLLLLPVSLIVYKIRHLGNPVSSVITYALLCCFTWLVLIPVSEICRPMAYERIFSADSREESFLSKGYFRHVKGQVYYFLEDSEEDTADTILIGDSGNPMNFGGEVQLDLSPESEYVKQAAPFFDILVSDSLHGGSNRIIELFLKIKTIVSKNWKNGFLCWLCFSSFGLYLASAYIYIRISCWRLISNACVVFHSTFVILWAALYFSPEFQSIRDFMNRLVLGTGDGRLSFFSSRGIELPFVLINLFMSIVTIASILISISIKNRKE